MRALLSIAAVLLVLCVMAASVLLGLRQLAPQTAVPDTPDRVAILVVNNRDTLDVFRDSLEPEWVIASAPDAFALDQGRIVTSRIEAGSELLNQLGWAERPLEIIDPRKPAPYAGGAKPVMSEIALLAQKKTLTAGEAIRALQLMR